MGEYEPYEPCEPRPASDHARVVTSGAFTGAAVFACVFGWLDSHLPHLAAFTLDWAAILAVCYAVACWKRAWYAWLAFWGMAVTCLLCGVLQLAGAMRGPWTSASWVTACLIVFIWYWLVRMPRLQPAVQAIERREIHVVHHVVHHGPQLPGWTATPVPAPGRKVIAGTRAIEPPRRMRDALTGPVTSTMSRIRYAITSKEK